jgi:hypothetical protein
VLRPRIRRRIESRRTDLGVSFSLVDYRRQERCRLTKREQLPIERLAMQTRRQLHQDSSGVFDADAAATGTRLAVAEAAGRRFSCNVPCATGLRAAAATAAATAAAAAAAADAGAASKQHSPTIAPIDRIPTTQRMDDAPRTGRRAHRTHV